MSLREMRKFKRVPFSSSQKVDAICRFPDENERFIRLHIANISEGGIGLILSRKNDIPVRKYDRLILDRVVGNTQLSFIRDLEMEVKWILDSDQLAMLGFGCSFRNIPETLKSEIIRFMNGMDSFRMHA